MAEPAGPAYHETGGPMRKSFALLTVLLLAAAAPSAASAQTFEELNANSIKFVHGAFINLVLPGPVAAHVEGQGAKKAAPAKKRGKAKAKRGKGKKRG